MSDTSETRARLFAGVLHGLSGQGWQTLGALRCGWILQAPVAGPGEVRWRSYELWMLSDNGGELNVERINSPETLVSIPYEQNRCLVDAGTVGFWVYQALTGEPRDYTERLPEFLECAGVMR